MTTDRLSLVARLRREVDRFRLWASIEPEPKSGEWECDYEDWEAIYEAFTAAVEGVGPDEYDDELIDLLLYCLARDNECEVLSRRAQECGLPTLLALTRAGLLRGEPDAKWQLAVRLGETAGQLPVIEELLTQFVLDPDEYTSRRALMALARAGSSRVESLAERAWANGHEYQRITALQALFDIRLPRLDDFLLLAEKDGRQYLVANAQRLRAAEHN